MKAIPKNNMRNTVPVLSQGTVKKERMITDEDLKHGITGDQLIDGISQRLKKLFEDK